MSSFGYSRRLVFVANQHFVMKSIMCKKVASHYYPYCVAISEKLWARNNGELWR